MLHQFRGWRMSRFHDQKHLPVSEVVAGEHLYFLVYMYVCMGEYAHAYFVRSLRFTQEVQVMNEPPTHIRALPLSQHLGLNGESTE